MKTIRILLTFQLFILVAALMAWMFLDLPFRQVYYYTQVWSVAVGLVNFQWRYWNGEFD